MDTVAPIFNLSTATLPFDAIAAAVVCFRRAAPVAAARCGGMRGALAFETAATALRGNMRIVYG